MNAKNATMNVACSRTLGTIVGGVALLLSIPAHALSLGSFQVESALDEPLKAEIQLNSVDPGTLDSLEVTLGTADDFQRADVPRSEYLEQLKFKVITKNKQPMVEVTTDKPIKEPFLHFLISAQWQGGKLVREYTGLLDPPLYAAGKPAAVESPAMGSTAATSESSSSASEATSQASSQASSMSGGSMSGGGTSSSTGTMSGSSGRAAEFGPTQKGDTLWAIAAKLDTGSLKVNVFQVMIALLRANPDAFIDNNINRLKTGQILRLKDVSSVADVSPEDASVAYAAQLQEWESYKSTIASSGGEVELPSQEPTAAASESTTTAMASESAETSGTTAGEGTGTAQKQAGGQMGSQAEGEGGNVLKIVQATVDKSNQSQTASAGTDQSGEIAELRSQIATLQESLDSRNLENKDLQERVKLLETQVQNAQRLVNIQDQQLAEAQQQAAEKENGTVADTSAQQVTTEPAAPAEKSSEDTSSASMSQKDEQPGSEKVAKVEPVAAAPAPKENKAAPARQEASVSSTAAQSAKPKPASKPTQQAPKVRKVANRPPMSSWWAQIPDMLFSSWMWMVGAGAGVLVLVLGLLMFLRRRQSIAEFEESILSGSALDSYSETTDTAGTSASDTSFLSDFGTAGMGTMQADEVDPLAEAEVYLAYGRDEQAEDVLKEAARRDPDRSEIKLKLLEIYKQRNDVKSFETIAEELYPAAGAQGDPEIWNRVTEMGREVNPNNPLFQGSGSAPGGRPAPTPAPATTTQPAAPSVTAADDSVNLDLDNPAPARSGSPASRPLGDDVGDEPAPQAPSRPAAPVASARDNEGDTLDFGDDFLEQTSKNVDPSTQPFPAPDQQTDLDRELERLAGEREAAAKRPGGGEESAPSREVDWDKAESDTESSTLDFPASDTSEIDFDLNLDETSIQQLSASDQGAASDAGKAASPGNGEGGGLMEFESENIPPEETWAGASTDAAPGSDDDAVSYSPTDDVQSSQAPQYNEADTKLDLARAYLDMGDKVGARSIIDEVMREGDPAQRDQAAELASQL